MTLAGRKAIASTALAAVLFAAVSPAIAGLLFVGRAEILARLLAIPASSLVTVTTQAAAGPDVPAHEHAEHSAHDDAHSGHPETSNHEAPTESGHRAHGVFCSFCLSPSSTVALHAPVPAAWEVAATYDCFIPEAREQRPSGVIPSTHHPRDPPVILS